MRKMPIAKGKSHLLQIGGQRGGTRVAMQLNRRQAPTVRAETVRSCPGVVLYRKPMSYAGP